MRLRLFGLLAAAVLTTSSARAAEVVVVGPHGHASVRNDPYLPAAGPAAGPIPPVQPVAAPAARHSSAHRLRADRAGRSTRLMPRGTRRHHRRRRPEPTVTSVLAKLLRSGQITAGAEAAYLAEWRSALATERRLHGTRRTELEAITVALHDFAVNGSLTAPRLPVLFLTLQRNQQYWTTGPLLVYGQRVEFSGSQVVWEYYPGQGIQLQVLATFGRANGLYTAGPADYPQMRQLLAEMIPLAVPRGGGMAWEYYFPFDGGAAPWVSAMAEGTALEALGRAASVTPGSDGTAYLNLGHTLLPLFEAPAPAGVGVRTSAGMRYLQYSFAPTPDQDIINAFLQSLIGLDTFAQVSHDPLAEQLFTAGNAEAESEVPQFDTGAWSLYQPGLEDDLSYHELVTGFLNQLCTLVGAPVYCTTAQHFTAYVKTPPALSVTTVRVRARRADAISFTVSKISRVGIVVRNGARTLLATSANFPYGTHTVAIPTVRHPGQLTVRLAATDLAGNFSQASGVVAVVR